MRTLTRVLFLSLVAVFGTPAFANAQQSLPVEDRMTFGGDVHIRAGETVHDVVTMGGDALVEGEVLGDLVTMGGNAHITGTVAGDVATMGGDLVAKGNAQIGGDAFSMGGTTSIAPTASVLGEITRLDKFQFDFGPGTHEASHSHRASGFAAWLADAATGLVTYGLLFVLGLILMGVARERLDGLQLAIVKQPVHTTAMGVVGFVAAALLVVVLAVTVIGIPAAILLALALPIAVYIGMTGAASVIGATMPIEAFAKRPVLQLAAGVTVLWLASLVPYLGSVLVGTAAVIGLGALLVTRFRKATQVELERTREGGPYRAQT